MTDLKLLALLKTAKPQGALNQLYNEFPTVRNLVLKEGGSEEDAKDAFQESVWVLYQNCQKPDFQLSASIRTYLSAVSLNQWRKKKRDTKKEITKDSFLESTDQHGGFTEEMREQEAEMEILAEKILDSLGEPCAKVLKAYYYLKFSMREIAENLGYSSENSAKTQKYKCLERAKNLTKTLFKHSYSVLF